MNHTKDICGIYIIFNTVNRKFYIGSSSRIKKRFAEHQCLLKYNNHTNPILQHSYNKYGADKFRYEIIDECKESELLVMEDKYIVLLKSMDRNVGFNLEIATRPCQNPESNEKRRLSMLGRPCSEETRKRLSESLSGKNNPMYGKHHTIEFKKLLSDKFSNENNPNFGKHHTEEAKEKIRKAHKGVYGFKMSEETKQKMSIASKGKKKSPEAIQHMRESKLGKKHGPMSQETKDKISNARKMYYANKKATQNKPDSPIDNSIV